MRLFRKGNRPAPVRPPGSLAELLHAWRYFFWVLGLAAVVIAFYAEENWRGQRAWESYKQRTAARGIPVVPSAFTPPLIPEEENFAMTPFLAPLFQFIPGTQRYLTTGVVERIQGFAPAYDAASSTIQKSKESRSNSWVTARTDLAAWHAAFLDPAPKFRHSPSVAISSNAPVSPAAAALGVLEGLSECEPVLEELHDAARTRPRCRFNVHYEQEEPASILLPHLAVLKHLCQVLRLRASAELVLGRTNDAASDVDLMFYLTEASRNEPFLISQLVRISLLQLTLQPLAEGLNHWSDAQLSNFQARLAHFDFCDDLKRTMEAERAFLGDEMIDYIRRAPHRYRLIDSFGGNDPPGGSVVAAALIGAAPSGWFCLEQVNYSRTFDDLVLPAIDVAARRIDPAASQQAERRIAIMTAHVPSVLVLRHRFFSRLMLPAICRPLEKGAFAQTAADAGFLACALERFRRVHAQFPESLEALRPAFLQAIPHDVVNGQPLQYRRTESGSYVLYSVGWNNKDDGGIVSVLPNRESPSAAPGRASEAAEGDWVWRVP